LPKPDSMRSRLSATPSKAVAYDVPPVNLPLDPVPLVLEGRKVDAGMTARLYDFGVVSLELRIDVQDCSWADYTALLNALDREVGPTGSAQVWAHALDHVRELVAPSFVKPSNSKLQEDYLLGVVQRWSRPIDAAGLEAAIDLVPLLSGDTRTLSEGARR